MQEIRIGLREGLNVSIYANPEYPWGLMREMRQSLKYFKLVNKIYLKDRINGKNNRNDNATKT